LREGDRRRILEDPASKVVHPLVIGHRVYGKTTTDVPSDVTDWPASSTTVNCTK
jgi:hypothetical protein